MLPCASPSSRLSQGPAAPTPLISISLCPPLPAGRRPAPGRVSPVGTVCLENRNPGRGLGGAPLPHRSLLPAPPSFLCPTPGKPPARGPGLRGGAAGEGLSCCRDRGLRDERESLVGGGAPCAGSWAAARRAGWGRSRTARPAGGNARRWRQPGRVAAGPKMGCTILGQTV
ncbi:hypothetical protein MC885_011343 [Smutsia gigantea]|nr:hypothetical protein MC885_011343 [Smutsia gigantea]